MTAVTAETGVRLNVLPPKCLPRLGRQEVQALLSCSPEEVPVEGHTLMDWLRERPPQVVKSALDFLAQKLSEGWLDPAHEKNRLAGLEILVRWGHARAWPITLSRLRVRPVTQAHLYLVPLPRLVEIPDKETKSTLALAVAATLDEPPPRSPLSLSVEVFRTLAKLDPALATGPVCRVLARPMGLEETAVWNAVADAAVQVREAAHDWSPLAEVAKARLDELMAHPNPDDVDNFTGITSCLMEIAGRCGVAWAELMGHVERHAMGTSIVYQLVQRRLDFLTEAQRADAYVRTLRGLWDQRQVRTHVEVMARFAKDLPRAYQAHAITLMTPPSEEPADARS